MAKLTNYIPEPKQDYDVEDLKNEQDAFNYFLS